MTITEPGFYYDMPARDYHADPAPSPSLSSTIARTIIAKSLAHAHGEHPRLGARLKKKQTDAMSRGSLVHAIISGSLKSEVSIGDFATFRGKEAQDWKAKAEAAGKIPVLREDLTEAEKIAESLRLKASRGVSMDLFSEGRAEVSAFWQKNGAWFRARYDRLISPDNEPSTAIDWKVTKDVSLKAVKNSMRRFGYAAQAAHYLSGLDALRPQFRGLHSFVFVFVEDSWPYSVRRYALTGDCQACAAIDMASAHDQWIKAIETGDWPDASSVDTTFVDLPSYDDDEDVIEVE